MHRLHSSTTTTGTSTQGFLVRIGKRLQQYVSAFHRARQARDEIPNTTMKTVQIRETISWYVGKGAYWEELESLGKDCTICGNAGARL